MSAASDLRLPREEALAGLLAAEGLDAVVSCTYEGLSYLAGTDIQTQLHLAERLEFLVWPRDADPTLLVCNIEESQVRTQSPIGDVRAYVEFEDDPAAALGALLEQRDLAGARIGIEGARLPSAALRTLERRLPGAEWGAVDRQLERLQVVKTGGEVERLAEIARTLLNALDETLAAVSGGDEQRYASELVGRVAAAGVLPLFLVFAAGERTALGHPEPGRVPMREGTVWRTDYGARLPGGLCGDVARTGVVGAASVEQAEIFAAVRAAQDAAVAAAEPGRPARELFHAVRRTFERNGLPFSMPHVGHGIGIGLHEAPVLEPRNDAPLQPGTVVNIEPFAILPDRGEGYHTEDLVLVGENGPVRLTTPQDELLRIGGGT